MSSLQEQKTLSSIMWNFARRNEHERLKSFLLEHSNDFIQLLLGTMYRVKGY